MSRTEYDYDPDLKEKGGGFDLSVFAELAFSLGRIAKASEREQDRRDRAAAMLPGDYQNAAAALYPLSGSLALDLGSPALGTQWQVRRIIVGGSDITTTPAGTAWMFVQGSNPIMSGANPSIAQAADLTTGTLPQRAFYGTHQLMVLPGEHLWIIITSGTSQTQYVASVKAETFPVGHSRSFFEE